MVMKRSWTGSPHAKSTQLLQSSLASISDQPSVVRFKEQPSSHGSIGHSAFERKFPFISYLVNEPTEWEAMFKILKLAEKIVNTKAISRTDKWKEDLALLVKMYKEWWTILGSHPTLQDKNVRQLSRHLREFIMVAVEEPMHSIPLEGVTMRQKRSIKGKLPIRRTIHRVTTVASLRSPSKISPYYGDSGISRILSVTESLASIGGSRHSRFGPLIAPSVESMAAPSGSGRPVVARREPSVMGVQHAQGAQKETLSEHAYSRVLIDYIMNDIQKTVTEQPPTPLNRKTAIKIAPNTIDRSQMRRTSLAAPWSRSDRKLSVAIGYEAETNRSTISDLLSSTTYGPLGEMEVSGKDIWETEKSAPLPSKPLLNIPHVNRSLVSDFEQDWKHQRKGHVAILKFSSLQEKARCTVNVKQGVGFIRSLGKPGFRPKVCP